MKKIAFVLFSLMSFVPLSYGQGSLDDHIELGLLYQENLEFEKSIEELTKAKALARNDGIVNYELAHSYYLNGQADEAIALCNHVLKRSSMCHLESYKLLGKIYIERNDSKNGIKWLKRGADNFPDDEEINMKLADLYYLLGDFKNSARYYEEVVWHHPANVKAHYLLGSSVLENKKYTRGLMAYYFFLFSDPFSENAPDALSKIYNLLRNNSEHFDNGTFFYKNKVVNNLPETSDIDPVEFTELTKAFMVYVLQNYALSGDNSVWSRFYPQFMLEAWQKIDIEVFCRFIGQSVFGEINMDEPVPTAVIE